MFGFYYKKLALLLATITIFSGIGVFVFADDLEYNEKLEFVRELIRERYIDEVSDEILEKQDIDEIFDNLDRYSEYMTVDKSDEFMGSIDLEYEGIGVRVEKIDGGLLITSVFEDGGAYESGLEPGDVILEVDQQSIADLTLQESVSLIRGEEGTFVNLVVYQDKSFEYIEVDVERRKINAPLVEFERLGGNIGYIRLYSFGTQSANKIAQAIKELGDVNYYIFDIRNNSGGYLSMSQAVLGFFNDVNRALIVRRRDAKDTTYFPFNQQKKFEKDVITLINEYSASASEIVAGALSDYDASTLYGQETFGKGSVQSIFEIKNTKGDVVNKVKLTTARFLSPEGTVIDEKGIKPDVITKEGEELLEAHKDLLKKVYDHYNELTRLERDVKTKSFEVNFTAPIKKDSINEKFKIVKVGSKALDIEYEKISDNKVKISLNEDLKEDNKYILYIHPGIEGKSGSVLKQGYNVKVSVGVSED